MVCHPSRTYPPKELRQEPQNRSFPFSPPPNYTPLYLLPLTYNLTTSYIGWVQAGGAWALRVLPFHVCSKSAYYSCVCCGLELRLYSLPLFFVLLYGPFYNSLFPLGAGLHLILGFTFLLAYFLIAIMSYHITLLFLLYWLDPTVPFLDLPCVLSHDYGFSYLWAPVSLLFSLRHPLLICLPWASSTLFFNFVFPWAFTNFIRLPWPNYLILIFGVCGLAINPLLSLFTLLWAYCGPFLLFHIVYCPWVCYSLFLSFQALLSPFAF